MTAGKVSIIMPVWNGEPWVGEAIQSVLTQDYSNWELLIIDNGSTDGSKQIIESFSDPRIALLTQTHSGVSYARNLGLKHCTGEFLCFLDCDDRLPEKSLSSRVELFQSNPELMFVDGQVIRYGSKLERVESLYQPEIDLINPLEELMRLSGKCFVGITWMIRRSQLEAVSFHNELTHSEDLCFFAEASSKGGLYSSVKEPIYEIRTRSNSAMRNLEGLAHGYSTCFEYLKTKLQPTSWQDVYKRKVQRILFRSHLKSGKILTAISLWLRWR